MRNLLLRVSYLGVVFGLTLVKQIIVQNKTEGFMYASVWHFNYKHTYLSR